MCEKLSASGDPAEIPELLRAVEHLRAAIAGTPARHPDRALYLHDLSLAQHTLAHRTGSTDLLREALRNGYDAITAAEHTPTDHPVRVAVRANLRNISASIFQCSGDTTDLAALVQADRALVAAAAPDHPDRTTMLYLLWSDLAALGERTPEPALLGEIADTAKAAVATIALEDPEQPAALADLLAALLGVFERSHELRYLEDTVRLGADAVHRLRSDNPARTLLSAHVWRAATMADHRLSDSAAVFALLDDPGLIHAIATDARTDLAGIAPRHPEYAETAHRLCHAVRLLSERTPDDALLTEIIRVASTAVEATEDELLRQALTLDRYFAAIALTECNPGPRSIAQRDSAARAVVTVFATELPPLAELLTMSRGLRTMADNAVDPAALSTAVAAARILLGNLNGHDPRRPAQLHTLSALLGFQFERQPAPRLADEAVFLGREACTTAAAHGAVPLSLRLNLGLALQQQYEACTDPTVLQEAVQVWREIVAATAAESAEYRDHLTTFLDLARTLVDLRPSVDLYREVHRGFEILGRYESNPLATLLTAAAGQALETAPDPDALRRQIASARQILASGTLSETDRATAMMALATLLTQLGHHTQDPAVLAEAAEIGRATVAALPEHDPDLPGALLNLFVALILSYNHVPDLENLREAVQVSQRALAVLPENDPHRATFLSAAGVASNALASHTGAEAARRDAVVFGQAAMQSPDTDDIVRTGILINYGQTLGNSHQAYGDLASCAEAVRLGRAAVAAAPAGMPNYHQILEELGDNLMRLYHRSGDPAHLSEAVRTRRAALKACPAGHPDLPILRLGLSISMARTFDRSGDLPDIEEAIALCRQTLAADVGDRRHVRLAVLSTLADHLHHRFYAAPETATGNECLRIRREVVASTPDDHVHRAHRQLLLGAELAQRLMFTQDRRLLPELLSALRAAFSTPGAPLATRMTAARLLEFAEVSAGNHARALAAMEAAVDLLPRTTSRALARSDREHSISRQAGIATAAAAAAVTVGRPQRAVELLEHCRGILIGEALDDRHDLAELAAVAPRLADELKTVRDQLLATEDSVRADNLSTLDDAAAAMAFQTGERRRALAEHWTVLVEQVRALPGFDGFLRPPELDSLRRGLDGPVVMVFAHLPPAGGHALIVPADPREPVTAVPLPDLTVAARMEKVTGLDALLAERPRTFAERADREQRLHELLEWLWDAVTEPVLRALRIAAPSGERPRVWWCPIGDLAFLPIQAAGYHRDGSLRTVLDRTASSFLTTLRAFDKVRPGGPVPAHGAAVLISMPETPGATPLANADREVEAIAAMLPGSPILRGPAATAQSVSQALARHPITHFACHAQDNPAAPSTSRLLLHDNDTTPFSVTTLLRLHLKNAGLAYLSACSTTRTSPLLVDEAIHLTATIHLAGYRHVIGTLWPINDSAAEGIATEFYRHLTDDGRSPANLDRSVYALNQALRNHRDHHLSSPTRWAAHLHYGR